MGDIDDNIFSGKPQIMVFDDCSGKFENLGTIMDSKSVLDMDFVRVENESEPTFRPGRDSYSFNFKADIDDDIREFLYPKPLRIAESMRKDINNLIKAYGFLKREKKPNRRERREREREIKKRLSRYISFCNENGLQIHIKQRQSW